MKIAVRADLSRSIGTGHLLRCRSLIESLKNRGVQAVWITRQSDVEPRTFLSPQDQIHSFSSPDHFSEVESKEWFRHYDWQKDAKETVQILSRSSCSTLLVDHYALDARWVDFVKRHDPELRIVFIDDLANRPLHADAVIDPNLRVDGYEVYKKLIDEQGRVYGGPLFNPLICKKDLREIRQRKNKFSTTRPQRILLFFGGADTQGATHHILQALLSELWQNAQFSVVAGPANVHKEKLQKMIQGRPEFSYLEFVEKWAEFMEGFDIAIGAAGTSAWERAFIGLPSINFAISDNQVLVGEESAKAGAAIYLGLFSEPAIPQLMRTLKEWLLFSEKPAAVMQRGRDLWPTQLQGLEEPLLQVILRDKKIEFVKADPSHCQILFDWRNDPETRRSSVQQEEISLATHTEWFTKSLNNPNRRIYMGQLGSSLVGMVRFDLDEKLERKGWELSWSVAPMWRGQGIGKELVKQATELVNHNLWAKILLDNKNSMKVAEFAGFQRIGQDESLSFWEKGKVI